jgi:two-component system OmpR family sensor kinase
MRRLSLRVRIVLATVLVVAGALALLDVVIYVTVRQRLDSVVVERLDERAERTADLAADVSAEELAERLQRAGIPAIVRPAEGPDMYSNALVSDIVGDDFVQRTVAMPDGGEVDVLASDETKAEALRVLRTVEILGTIACVSLAGLGLGAFTGRALRPIAHVVGVAERVAAGDTSRRLRPESVSTEVGRMEAAVDRMLDSLERRLDEARHASELNRQFLADAAHQLRTPMTAVRAAAGVLDGDCSDTERERLLAVIERGTDRLGLLVTAMLRMAQLDQGEEPDLSPEDLVDLCEEEVGRIALLSPQLDVSVEAPPAAVTAGLDRASMREALGNLLDNARRHALTRITVTVEHGAGEVRLRVLDDGPGMDRDTAVRVFDRFASFDACGGAGLGLPIARAIVDAHGGSLVYEGRAFVIRLPPAPAPAHAGPVEAFTP